MTRAASTAPPRPVELPLSPVPAAIREAYGRPRGRCPRPDLRVAVWLWPLLDRTVTALMDELEALPLRANDLEAQLVEALPWHQLVMMADRTLLLHMHIEGLFGRLDGPTPAARAASFLVCAERVRQGNRESMAAEEDRQSLAVLHHDRPGTVAVTVVGDRTAFNLHQSIFA